MAEKTVFEPSKYITKVGNADYLEVKWRLVWFRAEHPDGVIDTELSQHEGATAVFRARVSIPGGGVATGWGSESADDFRDYLEKAETKALGRALAALGYGTQFCPDFEFGAAEQRIVDSPISLARTRGRQSERAASGATASADLAVTEKQLRFLHSIASDAGLSEQDLQAEAVESFGHKLQELSRREASALIEQLQQQRRGDMAAAS